MKFRKEPLPVPSGTGRIGYAVSVGDDGDVIGFVTRNDTGSEGTWMWCTGVDLTSGEVGPGWHRKTSTGAVYGTRIEAATDLLYHLNAERVRLHNERVVDREQRAMASTETIGDSASVRGFDRIREALSRVIPGTDFGTGHAFLVGAAATIEMLDERAKRHEAERDAAQAANRAVYDALSRAGIRSGSVEDMARDAAIAVGFMRGAELARDGAWTLDRDRPVADGAIAAAREVSSRVVGAWVSEDRPARRDPG